MKIARLNPRSGVLARVGATAMVLIPSTAWAHPGHEGAGGMYAGVAHPVTGIDHLVAMLLVGAWAGLLAPKGRSPFALPAAFIGAMLAGFLAGPLIGGTLAEPLILASLITLGAIAAFSLRAPLPVALATVTVFGFAHGMAHGFETPGGAIPALFAAGFAVTTATLHGIGLWLVRMLPAPAMRMLGASSSALALILAGSS